MLTRASGFLIPLLVGTGLSVGGYNNQPLALACFSLAGLLGVLWVASLHPAVRNLPGLSWFAGTTIPGEPGKLGWTPPPHYAAKQLFQVLRDLAAHGQSSFAMRDLEATIGKVTRRGTRTMYEPLSVTAFFDPLNQLVELGALTYDKGYYTMVRRPSRRDFRAILGRRWFA